MSFCSFWMPSYSTVVSLLVASYTCGGGGELRRARTHARTRTRAIVRALAHAPSPAHLALHEHGRLPGRRAREHARVQLGDRVRELEAGQAAVRHGRDEADHVTGVLAHGEEGARAEDDELFERLRRLRGRKRGRACRA